LASALARVASLGLPVIAGGRSAGAQVASRTAKDLGAVAVLALSYPLLGPGSPRELLATCLPMLILQGGLDRTADQPNSRRCQLTRR
jgi:predicted alpha/beta-hydrolase family hydrolase